MEVATTGLCFLSVFFCCLILFDGSSFCCAYTFYCTHEGQTEGHCLLQLPSGEHSGVLSVAHQNLHPKSSLLDAVPPSGHWIPVFQGFGCHLSVDNIEGLFYVLLLC